MFWNFVDQHSWLITVVSAVIALCALLVNLWHNGVTRARGLRVEKSNSYLNLEVASSAVFKYEAEHSVELAPYRKVEVTARDRNALHANVKDAMRAYNLYFQTLNLFEVCARFRRQDVIEHEVFASWVAWFYDTLDDWYFRDQWADLRTNYTDDVRDIFDLGVPLFDGTMTDAVRKDRFFALVSQVMNCAEIAGWQAKLAQVAIAPPTRRPGRFARYMIRTGRWKQPSCERRPISSPEPSEAIPAT